MQLRQRLDVIIVLVVHMLQLLKTFCRSAVLNLYPVIFVSLQLCEVKRCDILEDLKLLVDENILRLVDLRWTRLVFRQIVGWSDLNLRHRWARINLLLDLVEVFFLGLYGYRTLNLGICSFFLNWLLEIKRGLLTISYLNRRDATKIFIWILFFYLLFRQI